MPELPEVEVTRRSFADRIAGASVRSVRMGKPLRWPLGVAPRHIVGQSVLDVGRRGKYLLIQLDQGVLLVHLGMSGSLQFMDTPVAPGVHDHFDLVTSRGLLRLHDPRRFGAVVFAPDLDDPRARKLLGGLGVEPLEGHFEAEGFHQALLKRRSSIKQVLLAGDIVVGVGNIYASEALFRAHIRPTRRADRISRPQATRLQAAIVDVLQRALALGGSTLRDFSSAQGQTGYFQLDAMVYGRAGLPCRVCGTAIKLIRQGQRASFFCPQCQKT
jgi:formamidopyrimidine-DNA glycosylase